jgi:hypothetical protein
MGGIVLKKELSGYRITLELIIVFTRGKTIIYMREDITKKSFI